MERSKLLSRDVSGKAKIALATLVLVTMGCSSTGQMPTHRWASTEDADRAKYQQDHARCQSETGLSTGRSEIETDSTAFKSYKQCMNNSGYVLTAYNQ